MAEKKTSTKKKTGSASAAKSSSRSGTKKSVAAKESTRAARVPEEELESGHSGAFWGVILLALGIFMIISYFSKTFEHFLPELQVFALQPVQIILIKACTPFLRLKHEHDRKSRHQILSRELAEAEHRDHAEFPAISLICET